MQAFFRSSPDFSASIDPVNPGVFGAIAAVSTALFCNKNKKEAKE